eukprot:38038_1
MYGKNCPCGCRGSVAMHCNQSSNSSWLVDLENDSDSYQGKYNDLVTKYNNMLDRSRKRSDQLEEALLDKNYKQYEIDELTQNNQEISRRLLYLKQQNELKCIELRKELCLQIEELKEKNNKIQEKNTKISDECTILRNDNKKLKEINNKMSEEYKELEYNHNELKNEYDKLKKRLGHKAWNAKDIVDWIIGIDAARFQRYYQTLLQNMTDEGIDGSCLADLERDELKGLGITQFKDRREIFHAIKKLTQSSNQSSQAIVDDNGLEQEGASGTPYVGQ